MPLCPSIAASCAVFCGRAQLRPLSCLEAFDLAICGIGLFVRPLSREVGDNESNEFRVIGGIMRRLAKAASRTFGCAVALALATGLGAAVPAMADEIAAPYEGDLQASAQAEGWQTWGGCEWMVDSEGCLTIRPNKDSANVGQLPDCGQIGNPWGNAPDVESVKIEKGVRAADSVRNLFTGLSSVASMDLSDLDVSQTTDLSSLFYGCSHLTSLDLSGWDVSNVTAMDSMFSDCWALTSLDLSGWDVSSVTEMWGDVP